MRSVESLFNDSQWEIRIPNARIESLQEEYKAVIQAKPRTHVEAAFVDAVALAASSQSGGQSPMYKSPNGRPGSSQLMDKRVSSAPPGPFGPRAGGYDQGRVESTLLFSYAYNSSEPGKELEIRPINGLWTAIFPFSVPVSFVRTKSSNTMLMLSAHVVLRPSDQVVPAAVSVDDQYNLDCFSMVNLLDGLSDDPSFAASVVPQHHYRPDAPRARIQAPSVSPILRRSVRRTIAVRSALNVRMRTTRVSPMENPLMMSIEVENNSEHGAKFKMTQLDVEVTHAVVTPLDSAELTKWRSDSPSFNNSPFGGHSRHSSEILAQPGSARDAQRQVTIVLQGFPEIDGVQGQTIHSRWNCFLDVSDLTRRDNTTINTGSHPGSNQKNLFAPQPSHPLGLLPSQHSASGTPNLGQSQNQQHQLHHRNRSLPSSPQPQQALQKGSSLARRVSNGSSPVPNNRNSTGANFSGDTRPRRSSLISDNTQANQQRVGATSSANRKSGLGGWGYGRTNENSQGLAPVHEGPIHNVHLSPLVGNATGSDAESYEDENLQVHGNNQGDRSPGLGVEMASQALNGAAQGRAEQESGDGIVVSFAVTDRVVVGKIFNLEIFIVNRSRHIRRYTLVVPNRKRAKGGDPSQGSKVLPPLPSGERAVIQNVPIDPYMEETELLRRHVDNETTEADIICLENNIRLSPLYPLTCQNLNLRFIAIKEQLHTIDLVQLVDNDTGFVTNLRNCLCFMAEASFGALSQEVPEVVK
ncbi:hypothetical protein BGZ76_004381 [Entomortierella beljakovae]|nr:hypothetical protein BGZ76_004381 [Entomortierella beljakovae]